MRVPWPVKQKRRPAASPVPSDGGAAPVAPSPRRRRGRRLLAALASVAAIALLAGLLRAPILTGVARFLTVRDPLRRADAIFVFGGDPEVRPFAAAALYRRGWAPRVLVPGMETGNLAAMGMVPTQTELFTRVLRAEGVPDSAVTVLTMPGGTASTTDDVAVLRGYLRRTGIRGVIAVTTAYHSRRARRVLRRGLRGMDVRVTMYAVAPQGFDESDWWRSEKGEITYFTEYVKLVRDLVVGDGRSGGDARTR